MNDTEILTPFMLISCELSLTNNGIKNYKKVLALFLEYFRVVRDEWLADGQPIDLFKECKTIAKLSYDIFKIEEQVENVCNLAD